MTRNEGGKRMSEKIVGYMDSGTPIVKDDLFYCPLIDKQICYGYCTDIHLYGGNPKRHDLVNSSIYNYKDLIYKIFEEKGKDYAWDICEKCGKF
jgi:hypothetical protein